MELLLAKGVEQIVGRKPIRGKPRMILPAKFCRLFLPDKSVLHAFLTDLLTGK